MYEKSSPPGHRSSTRYRLFLYIIHQGDFLRSTYRGKSTVKLHNEGMLRGGCGQDLSLTDYLINFILVQNVLLANYLHGEKSPRRLLTDYIYRYCNLDHDLPINTWEKPPVPRTLISSYSLKAGGRWGGRTWVSFDWYTICKSWVTLPPVWGAERKDASGWESTVKK